MEPKATDTPRQREARELLTVLAAAIELNDFDEQWETDALALAHLADTYGATDDEDDQGNPYGE